MDIYAICSHEKVDLVRNGAGAAIGRQCRVCLALLSAMGTCGFCGDKETDLRERVANRLYCSDACRTAGEAKHRSERAKAGKGKRQTGWKF